jgi:hypothetical protein
MVPGVRFVGSEVCASCHAGIFNEFRQTQMGRSMIAGNQSSFVASLPLPAKVYDKDTGQYFEVLRRDGHLYQSQYALDEDGRELSRQTWKIDYVIGAGANGFGFLIHRGGHLFEAPITYYNKTQTWSFSPGYEFHNYGFTRPILARCIICHSGQPRPVAGGVGLYEDPPFAELAVGCENCHGPGDLHVTQRREEQMMGIAPSEAADTNIVNPARLSGWLADNICMRCHQGQDARVLRPGFRDQDFRPGMELDKIISIFKIAPDPGSTPSSLLLEHYFGMTLSKCYRASAGALHCISCHDPHVQLSGAAATDFYKSRCLTCHNPQSCRLNLDKRQATNPPDDCVGCHMPKRTVTTITHAALTDHTIPMNPSSSIQGQPPKAQGTELLYLTGPLGEQESLQSVPPFVLFQAYNNLVRDGYPQFQQKKDELLNQVARTMPSDPIVLRALAERAFSQNTTEGRHKAIGYMAQIMRSGSINVDDSLVLASLYSSDKRYQQAVDVLERTRAADPYFREIYESLAAQYLALGKYRQALTVLQQGLELFPDDAKLRILEKNARSATLDGALTN